MIVPARKIAKGPFSEDAKSQYPGVISKRKTKDGEEINYSFTNASLAQYTEHAIAYMQAQRFFIEYSFREQKQVLSLDQFQT